MARLTTRVAVAAFAVSVSLLLLLLCSAVAVAATTPMRGPFQVPSATIRNCVGRASDPDEPAGCVHKLVVELFLDGMFGWTVEGGDTATVTRVNDTTLFNTTTVGTAVVSVPTLTFLAQLGRLGQQYAMSFTRNFSAALSEELGWDGSLYTCNPEGNPCGAFTRVDGTYVPRSSGLCCSCSYCVLNDCSDLRLGRFCHIGVFRSVCLEYSERNYSGFRLGALMPLYELRLDVSSASLPAGGIRYPLSSDTPTIAAPTLVGSGGGDTTATAAVTLMDLSGRDAFGRSNYSGHILFVPNGPDDDERVAAGADEWVLLPSSLVTMDGTECDKVGMSKEAWERLPIDQCRQPTGTCVGRQLEDLRKIDHDAMAGGGAGQYMAKYQGIFERRAEARDAGDGAVDVLYNNIASMRAARMRWTVAADSMPRVLQPSPGTISRAWAPATDLGVTSTAIHATAVNTGTAASQYYMSVERCIPGVVSDTGVQMLVLGPGQRAPITFSMTQPMQQRPRAFACRVVLRDAANSSLLSVEVTWTVGPEDMISSSSSSHVSTDGGNTGHGSHDNSHGGGGGGGSGKGEETCDECTFTDFGCVFRQACTWKPTVWMALIVALCTGVVLAADMVRAHVVHKRWKEALASPSDDSDDGEAAAGGDGEDDERVEKRDINSSSSGNRSGRAEGVSSSCDHKKSGLWQ